MDNIPLISQIFVNTINTHFEWDVYKAIANVHKHGIGFEEALTVFDDPYALFFHGMHGGEKRFQAIGSSMVQPTPIRIISLTFTLRQGSTVCRIISARSASRRERNFYERQI